MRRLVLSALVPLLVLLPAAPAGAEHEGTFTMSATRGVAGTTVTVSSVTPCPNADGKSVVAFVALSRSDTVAEQELQPSAAGSWSTSFTVPASARNGLAVVALAICLGADAFFVYGVETFVVISPPGQQDPVVRLAGLDRIGTAIEMSRDGSPDAGAAATVVLARSDSFADSLAGAPLASHTGGVLLLTPGNALPGPVAEEIRRVLDPSGTIYLLGGSAAIGDDVESQVRGLGYDVTRLAGTDRFGTAVRIAEEVESSADAVDRIVLADGFTFQHGLLAGSAAASATVDDLRHLVRPTGVVLLTNGGALPPATAGFVASHAAARRFAVGAPAAAADPAAEAIVGADHAATSVLVAQRFFPDGAAAGVATEAAFPDALGGGAHSADELGPLLFSAPDTLSPSVRDYLASRRDALAIAFVYGGTAAVSPEVAAAVSGAIS